MTISVNAIAFQDAGLWIAQCLEYDIVATASSVQGLRPALEKSIAGNMLVNGEMGRSGLDGIPPAPQRFHSMFAHANENLEPLSDEKSSQAVSIAMIRFAELESSGDR